MADVSLLRELLTSEFVTFLGTKLQDSRDEVQKLIEVSPNTDGNALMFMIHLDKLRTPKETGLYAQRQR